MDSQLETATLILSVATGMLGVASLATVVYLVLVLSRPGPDGKPDLPLSRIITQRGGKAPAKRKPVALSDEQAWAKEQEENGRRV